MKSKDQILLEQAYKTVSLKENAGASVEAKGLDTQPDLSQIQGAIQIKKNPSVVYKYRVSKGETIPSLEPNSSGEHIQNAPAGNIIITGLIKSPQHPEGEEWSQKPEKFAKDYVVKEEGKTCTAKGTSPVWALQINEPFTVNTSWGSKLQAKPGDYLTQYGLGDYGVLDQRAKDSYY
jgi:hypothetical protein